MPALDFNLVLSGRYADMLLAGLALSIELLLSSLVLALPLAVFIALMRLSASRILRALAWLFVESVRNVPLLAHLLFWYFGAPELLPEDTRTWLYDHNFEAIAAVMALTLYYAAYLSEDIRSGLRAVPRVQTEAARALGFGFLRSMQLVVLPQALRLTVPPLLSQIINLWKDTSVATIIGTAELMYQAAKIESATFRSFEPFVFATVSYLSISLFLSAAAHWFQRRYPARAT